MPRILLASTSIKRANVQERETSWWHTRSTRSKTLTPYTHTHTLTIHNVYYTSCTQYNPHSFVSTVLVWMLLVYYRSMATQQSAFHLHKRPRRWIVLITTQTLSRRTRMKHPIGACHRLSPSPNISFFFSFRFLVAVLASSYVLCAPILILLLIYCHGSWVGSYNSEYILLCKDIYIHIVKWMCTCRSVADAVTAAMLAMPE